MNWQRWILCVNNISVTSQTGQDSLCSRMRRRRLAVSGGMFVGFPKKFYHTPHCLEMTSIRWGRQLWTRVGGRPCHSCIHQIESDSGLSSNSAGNVGVNRIGWRSADYDRSLVIPNTDTHRKIPPLSLSAANALVGSRRNCPGNLLSLIDTEMHSLCAKRPNIKPLTE